MSFLSKLVVITVASMSLGSVACVIGETRTEVIEYDPHTAVAGLTCSSPYVKADLSKLTACKAGGGKGTGKGHCFARMKAGIDEKNAEEFIDPLCKDGEVCVDDNILTAAGGKLKECVFHAAGDQPGVCMANLSKQTAINFKLLKQGDTICADDEVCSPCTDPRNGEDTKMCGKVGVHEADCTEGEKGAKTELCCAGLGICMDKDGVPGGAGDSLPNDSCSQKKGARVCAPSALVDSKPEKCDAVAGLDGVCLPYCFANMVKGAQAGLRSSCNALSFCLPCAAAKAAGMDMPGCE